MYGGNECDGYIIEIIVCNIDLCWVDGNYFLWLKFSVCSKSCVGGKMK